jgi:hypothetical protein
MAEIEDDSDIVGQLAFVASQPELFAKEDMVAVMKAALAAILELRIEIRILAQNRSAPTHSESD